MKRTIISISLLMILTFPLTLYLAWLQFRRAQVEHKVEGMMKEGIEESDLVLLKFTLEQSEILLRWEHPGEFEYRGEMYDVVTRDTRGDSVYFWCWWDREETALIRHLAEMTNTLLPDEIPYAPAFQRLNSFVNTPYLIAKLIQPQAYTLHLQIVRPFEIVHYRPPVLDPPVPPPRSA